MHWDKQFCVCLLILQTMTKQKAEKNSSMRLGLSRPEVKTLLFSCHGDAFGLRPITSEPVVSCRILWGEQRNTLRVLLMDKSVCLIHTDPLFMVNPPLTRVNLYTHTQSLSHSLTQLPDQTEASFLTTPRSSSGRQGHRGRNLQALSQPLTQCRSWRRLRL